MKQENIGALWEARSKGGDDYMFGIIDGKKIVVFKNNYKKGKEPDWKIFPQQLKEEVPKKDEGEGVPF